MDGQPTGFTLPAALLAQYPALQTLRWDQLAPQTDDTSDFGGGGAGNRNSFDASSGGEFGFGDDESTSVHSGYGGGGSSPGYGQGAQMMGVSGPESNWAHQSGQDWTGDYGSVR